MARETKRVGIVGLGLIGGSLGLDLQADGWDVQGLVHRSATAERAKERGLVSDVSTDPACLDGCDLVILALPIPLLLHPEPSLLEALPAEAVITDVGSVKQPVLEAWRGRHPRFVASHPMAGTALAGVEAGIKGLFRGRPWIATPEPKTDPSALAMVQSLALSLGSHWLTAAAAQHDQAVALISHMPVLVSAALLRAVGDERDPEIRRLALVLASSGFADTTRVGGGNPDLGVAMASTNREALLRSLAAYRWSLEQLEDAVLQENWPQLQIELKRTQALRPGFLDMPAGVND
ncbi:prephenate dehydrogenase [Synechococcus sp. BL107]|jgi:arogenate dehydrogenase (NADP+)|uniref:prephenate/arogenate dehydrogenase n=1 Tax=Synechococcus sp. BL107 TaxID=313625 RepID=UPI0000E54161|nr:prephenate/arogenate dehydrogenase [Synechococcus sp. BL107]EAU70221.1 prephenate dehydrogenase [Synechococcus sp. BL107]|tara:strand:+ start:1850 stop:2725 length:876 start_codon:yes stop_codon:yes gene_type:complete